MFSANRNRREFFTCVTAAIGAAAVLPTLALGDDARKKSPKEVPKPPGELHLSPLSAFFQHLLTNLNPTVFSALISPGVYLVGVSRMVRKNLQEFKAGNLDREKLIYNNADKYSGVFLEIPLVILPAMVRASLGSFLGSAGGFLSPRQLSEAWSVTAYHGQSVGYAYLYNPLQAILRDAYIRALSQNDTYENDPRKVPLNVIAAELDSISRNLEGDGVTGEPRAMFSSVASRLLDIFFSKDPKNVAIPGAIQRDLCRLLTPRGVVDLLSLGLSYIVTTKSNFAFGRAAALPMRFGLYTRDMLERIERRGYPSTQWDEEFQTSISYAVNSGINNLGQGCIQMATDWSGLRRLQSEELPATHLREILGTVLSILAFFELQNMIERRVRAAVESPTPSVAISLAREYLRP